MITANHLLNTAKNQVVAEHQVASTTEPQEQSQNTSTEISLGASLLTMIEGRFLTREQMIEHINNVIANAHQEGLDAGYDQALFDMGTQQIAG